MSKRVNKPNELATTEESKPMSTQDAELQALLQDSGAEGLENITSDDVKTPRLAILQPTSPLSSEDGYSAGHIVNLQTQETYGREVELIPLFFWATAAHGMNGDLASRITPCHKLTACPEGQWVDNQPPKCTLFKNILVLPLAKSAGESLLDRVYAATPAVYAAKRTAIKGTTAFLTMASMLRVNGQPAPLYASMYKLKTVKVDGDKGTFFVPDFTRVELIKSADLFKYLRGIYVDMKGVSQRISDDVLNQETASEPLRAPLPTSGMIGDAF
jgi:hypothetical protein